jgi:hypothetical protein
MCLDPFAPTRVTAAPSLVGAAFGTISAKVAADAKPLRTIKRAAAMTTRARGAFEYSIAAAFH